MSREALMNMEENESIEFSHWEVLRVPGGWIYCNTKLYKMIFIEIPGM